jgi:hypothetical protein
MFNVGTQTTVTRIAQNNLPEIFLIRISDQIKSPYLQQRPRAIGSANCIPGGAKKGENSATNLRE